MGYPDTFTGFCVDSPTTWSQFHQAELTPKPFGAHDIDVEIEACGVCGSDVHTLTGGWGDFRDTAAPLCVGHEIIGRAVRIGPRAATTTTTTAISLGDRVGVGAQVSSCFVCDMCTAHPRSHENYCPHLVDTYNARYPDGSRAHGGFATHIRVHACYVFKIPDAIPSHLAAPLLCAGITTYSPLVRAGVGKGMRVGVVGIGGLGHLGLQWCVALGADTYALTHSPSKAHDCRKLGAHDVILTCADNWAAPWHRKFDFILNCADATDSFALDTYLALLRPGADFHMVGLPDKPLPPIMAQTLAANAPKLTASHLGNNQEMKDMLQLAADKGIRPWVETIEISEAGCKEAVERVKENKVHYRFTLTGYDKAFGTK